MSYTEEQSIKPLPLTKRYKCLLIVSACLLFTSCVVLIIIFVYIVPNVNSGEIEINKTNGLDKTEVVNGPAIILGVGGAAEGSGGSSDADIGVGVGNLRRWENILTSSPSKIYEFIWDIKV